MRLRGLEKWGYLIGFIQRTLTSTLVHMCKHNACCQDKVAAERSLYTLPSPLASNKTNVIHHSAISQICVQSPICRRQNARDRLNEPSVSVRTKNDFVIGGRPNLSFTQSASPASLRPGRLLSARELVASSSATRNRCSQCQFMSSIRASMAVQQRARSIAARAHTEHKVVQQWSRKCSTKRSSV